MVPYLRYVEPFAGGAAGFFAIRPHASELADSNVELVTTYRAVRNSAASVHEHLLALPSGSVGYEVVRASRPTTAAAVAARFLYLRAHAFGGLYRVNLRGEFNVPYGGLRRRSLPTKSELAAASAALRNTTLSDAPYDESLVGVGTGDLVYLDPPYITHRPAQELFNRYVDRIFTHEDHVRLAKTARELVAVGAFVLASNSYDVRTLSLYPPEDFFRFRIARSSRIAARPAGRGTVIELLAVSRNWSLGRSALSRRVRG